METEKRRGERIKGNRRRYRWQEEEGKRRRVWKTARTTTPRMHRTPAPAA